MNDYILLLSFIGIIVIFSILTEGVSRKNLLSKETSRKLLHIVAASVAGYASLVISESYILIAIAFVAVTVTFFAVKFKLFTQIDSIERESWGIFFLAVSYLILLLLFIKENREIVFTSMIILAFSDSFAALAGNNFGKKFFSLTRDKKSFLGSTVFLLTTYTTIVVAIPNFFDFSNSPQYLWLSAIVIALILTMFEAISSKGFDNFTVPVFGSLLLYILFVQNQSEYLNSLLIGILLAGVVAILSFRVKFLTADGAAATFLLAAFVFGLGGWKWTIPILTFFILSSVLSKVRKKVNGEVEHFFEKSSQRDFMQVIANGGIGGLLVIVNTIYPNEFLYVIYIASLSAVCADTWGTEIGTMTKTKTYNILNLKPIEQGMSGGISVIGTLGALAGTVFIALSGISWIEGNAINNLFVIIFAGLFGSMFDSFLGATIQARYTCFTCGKLTEKHLHCGIETQHSKGLNWLNNDIVNLFAGISGGLIVVLF